MATKYIVNNVSGQTITGNLTINGNLTVTGQTTGELLTYKSLFTQTGPIVGTSLGDFYNGLIIGEQYTITNYVAGDDFSNVAQVIGGVINQTGCIFYATGQTPTVWSNSSELTSVGDLIVDVLENNLGFDLEWATFAGPGIYVGYNPVSGPFWNNFDTSKTFLNTQLTSPFYPPTIQLVAQPGSFNGLNDVVYLLVWDFDTATAVNNYLYYTPVQLTIKKDFDTTPILLNGPVVSSYPFCNVSVALYCNDNNIETVYGNFNCVNDISELINVLNSDKSLSYLGTYSDDGAGGVNLEMPTNLVNQLCSNGTLTFEVFND